MLVGDIIEHPPSTLPPFSLSSCSLAAFFFFFSSFYFYFFLFFFYFFLSSDRLLDNVPSLSLGPALNYRDQEEQIYSRHVSSTSRQPRGSVGGEAGRITTESVM